MDEINAKNMDKSDKTDKTEWSKWVLRIELNKGIMVEKNIQIEVVNFALNQCYKNKIQCSSCPKSKKNQIILKLMCLYKLF